MKLIELEIEEFGKLTDRDFVLGKGMNLIEGPNESGKSTLLAFLRFMFYGFPRKNSAGGDERDKRLSYRNRRAAGRLLFEADGRQYRIYRAFFLRGSAGNEQASEELSVMALPEGSLVSLGGKTPGEYFFGLPAELYDSSLCVRQSEIDRVGAPGVGDCVSDFLGSGENDGALKNAERLLEDARRELLHLKGRGGKIAELEDCEGRLKDELSDAKAEAARLRDLHETAERTRRELAAKKAEAAELQACTERAHILRDLQFFEDLRRNEEETRRYREKLQMLAGRYGGVGVLDEDFSERVGSLLADKRSSEEYLRGLDANLSRLRAEPHSETAAETAEKIRAAGGSSEVARRFRHKCVVGRMFAIVAAVLLAVALAACAVAFTTPDLKTVFGVAGIVCAAVGVVCACVFAADIFSAHRFAENLGLSRKQMNASALSEFERQADAYYANRAGITAAEHDREEAKERDEQLLKTLRKEFEEACGEEYTTVEEGEQILRNLSRRQGEARMAVQAARDRLLHADQQTEWLRTRLAGLHEPELRARLSALPETSVGAEDPALWDARQTALSGEITRLSGELSKVEREEAAIAVTARDVGDLEHRNSETGRALLAARRRYQAIALAIEALGEATEDIRRGVAPRLRGKASEIFRELTGGAYEELYLDRDLSVSLDAGGQQRPLSAFSAGCQDAAYLSLRLALLESISEEPLPLLFDEALARLDDTRAKALVGYLQKVCREGGQCLLFTCHTREAEFLSEDASVRRLYLPGEE